MQPTSSSTQPLVHNKTRGPILAAGCVACIGLMVGAIYTPLYQVQTYGSEATITTNFKLDEACFSGFPSELSVLNGCFKYRCDDLKSQMNTIKTVYCITAAAIGLSLFLAIGDSIGAIRNRFFSVGTLAASALAALVGFIIVMVTYSTAYCGYTISDPPSADSLVSPLSTLSASPFLCMGAGIGVCVGVVMAAFIKDKPAPVAGEAPLNQPQDGVQQQQVVYGQPQQYVQQGQPQYPQPQQQVQYVQQPQQGQCAPAQQQPV